MEQDVVIHIDNMTRGFVEITDKFVVVVVVVIGHFILKCDSQ
jgi:hypothetical protein